MYWLVAQGRVEEAEELLENPQPRSKWKSKVRAVVNQHWGENIKSLTPYFRSTRNLNIEQFRPGHTHPVLNIPLKSTKDISRIAPKLKLLTGTYVLQTNRAAFNQNAVNPLCKLCNNSEETQQHFLFECPELEDRRTPILHEIDYELYILSRKHLQDFIPCDRLKLVLDPSHLFTWRLVHQRRLHKLCELEFHCKRLTFYLHTDRYRKLQRLGIG